MRPSYLAANYAFLVFPIIYVKVHLSIASVGWQLSEIAPKDKHPLDLVFVLTVSEKEGSFSFSLSHHMVAMLH